METLELLNNSEPSCKLASLSAGDSKANVADVKSCSADFVNDLAPDSAPGALQEPYRNHDSVRWQIGEPALEQNQKLQPEPLNYELESHRNRYRDVCDLSAAKIKQENDIVWKECVLCAGRTKQTMFDIYLEMTCCGQVTLCSYICKVSNLNLKNRTNSKFVCNSCYELINLVEKTEMEYLKHREILLDLIGHNPTLTVLDAYNSLDEVELVKVENCKSEGSVFSEDDEPLAHIKPGLRNKSKVDYTQREPSPICYRDFSGDNDLYYKVEAEGKNGPKSNKCDSFSFKLKKSRTKKRSKRSRLRVKEEIEQKHPSDMLVVELREPDSDAGWGKSKKENVEPKQVTDKSFKKVKKKRDRKESKEKIDLTCTRCNRTFSKRCYFDYHMARHNNTHLPFICEVCGKGFKNRKMCDVHVLMHQGIADYKCIPCNKLFPTKFAFLRHDKIHKGKPKYQCDLCGKSFIHQSSFRMHNLAHAGIKKHSCELCGLALLSSSHLSRHKRIHSGEKRYECDQCGKKFSEKYNMQSHMKTHMKGKERPPSPVSAPGKRKRWFRCEMCEEKFDRLFKLEIHLVDDHKVHLKKGRPKPRNTMKKMQRAQQAAASMVSAIASAMTARAGQLLSSAGAGEGAGAKTGASADSGAPPDVKPSVSSLDEKMAEAAAGAPVFKTSPRHHSLSPTGAYMSPPPLPPLHDNLEHLRAEHQSHQQAMRTASAVWPHMAYSMGAGYLSRMPDYTQH